MFIINPEDSIMKTKIDLENEINGNNSYVNLEGEYRIKSEDTKNFFVSGKYIRSGININTGEKVIDGSKAKIYFDVYHDPISSTALFCILKNVKFLKIFNLHIHIQYYGKASNSSITAIMNHSQKCLIKGCKIFFNCDNLINFNGIYNEGAIDTTLETQADNLILTENIIEGRCSAEVYDINSVFCGINNHFANSVSITNNYIFMQIRGAGEAQRTYGVINSGKYVRIENNNIKANGSHNFGKSLEAAFACGMLNEDRGEYLVFAGNNCVAEWGGQCVGIENRAQYVNISANKILATHTIKGHSVILNSWNCIFCDNVVTNTSRNPRFLVLKGSENVIKGNFFKGLLAHSEYKSGVGIWVEGERSLDLKVEKCIISGNIISCALDFGIILNNTEKNAITDNQFIKFTEDVEYVPILSLNSSENLIENNIYPKSFSSGGGNLFRNLEVNIQSIL